MRAPRAVVALLLTGTVLLSGCATDATGELRRAVADLTEAANERDAERVRSSADTVLERLADAVRANEVTTAEAARIDELTRLVRDRALAAFDQPEPEPEPEPEPVEEPSPEPTPEPTTAPPSPSPTPVPTTPPPSPEPGEDEEDDGDGGDGDLDLPLVPTG